MPVAREARVPSTRAECGAATPWSKLEKIALACFSLSVFASLAVLTHPWNELVRDASTYVVVSKSLLAGDGYSYLGIPFVLRPPGFPLMMAPVLGTWGLDFHALNLFVSVIGAIGVVLLFIYLRDPLGWVLALLVSTAAWLNPLYRELCNQVMSEVPSLTLVIACLLLERACGRRSSGRREVALGILLGLSILVRSVNWLLVAAILASRLLRYLRANRVEGEWRAWVLRRLLTPVAIAVLVVLPWNVYSHFNQAPAVDDQIGIHSYATALLHEDWGDPGSPLIGRAEIVERGWIRIDQITTVLGSRLSIERHGNRYAERRANGVEIIVSVALLAALFLALWKRGEPIEFLCLALLFLTLVYFGFRARLLLPVYVLSLPCALWVIHDFAQRRGRGKLGYAISGFLVLFLIALDSDPWRNRAELEANHLEWTESCSALSAALAPDARVATRLGTHFAACLDVPVYNLEFATRRLGESRGLESVVVNYQINTIFLSAESSLAPRITSIYGEGLPVKSFLVWRIRP
jgi:hypothetical protein